jgi:ribosomal protein S1
LNSWEILRYVYKIGSPIKGTVISYVNNAFVEVQTDTPYQCLIPYNWLFDNELYPFSQEQLPPIGKEINTVVDNLVDRTLYLTARPYATSVSTIKEWQAYYDCIDTLEIGSIVKGKVLKSKPFGLFVDLGIPYKGLIDIGGGSLPVDSSTWLTIGDAIICQIICFRLHSQQIDLAWLKT